MEPIDMDRLRALRREGEQRNKAREESQRRARQKAQEELAEQQISQEVAQAIGGVPWILENAAHQGKRVAVIFETRQTGNEALNKHNKRVLARFIRQCESAGLGISIVKGCNEWFCGGCKKVVVRLD